MEDFEKITPDKEQEENNSLDDLVIMVPKELDYFPIEEEIASDASLPSDPIEELLENRQKKPEREPKKEPRKQEEPKKPAELIIPEKEPEPVKEILPEPEPVKEPEPAKEIVPEPQAEKEPEPVSEYEAAPVEPVSGEILPEMQEAPNEIIESEAEKADREKGIDTRYPLVLRTALEYLETFCYALGVLIVLFLFVFRYVSVEGDSMIPTLHGGRTTPKNDGHADRLIITNLFYTPETGDIVVLNVENHSKPLIKRVIAAGGQDVKINFNTWEVWVDGVKLKEDYINYIADSEMRQGSMGEMYGIDENGICTFTVAEGKIFVMGDNRNDSRDSRFEGIGEVDTQAIMGRVVLRLFPIPEFGKVA